VPSGVKELFLPWRGTAQAGDKLVYRPALLGSAKLHFVDAKVPIDLWADASLLTSIVDENLWDTAEDLGSAPELDDRPDAKAGFDTLPAAASQVKSYAAWSKDFADWLYRVRTLELRRCAALKLSAKPGESEGDFKVRVAQAAREARDTAVADLRQKYAAKLAAIGNQEQRANERIAREENQASQQTIQTAISVGATVLGALFGRKALSVATMSRASTAARGVSRALKEREDVGGANMSLEAVRAKRAELEAELQTEIEKLGVDNDPAQFAIDTTTVRPRKSDITVSSIALVWVPMWVGAGGSARPAR
jgi:hypothetical protein